MAKREIKDEAVVPVRFSKAEYRKIVAAAKKAKLPVSTWMRVTLLRELDSRQSLDSKLKEIDRRLSELERRNVLK